MKRAKQYVQTLRRVVAAACTHGKRAKHVKPQGVVSDDQPEAREGQAGGDVRSTAEADPCAGADR